MEPKAKKPRRPKRSIVFYWKCSYAMIPIKDLSSIDLESCKFISNTSKNDAPRDPAESVDYNESSDDDQYYGDDVIEDALGDLKTPGPEDSKEDENAYFSFYAGKKFRFTKTTPKQTTMVPIFVFRYDADERWYGICYATLQRGQQPIVDIIIVDKLLAWSLPEPRDIKSILTVIDSDHEGVMKWPRCRESQNTFVVNAIRSTSHDLETVIKLTNLVGSEWSSMSSNIKYYMENVLGLTLKKDLTCSSQYMLSELLKNEMNTFAPGIGLQIHK